MQGSKSQVVWKHIADGGTNPASVILSVIPEGMPGKATSYPKLRGLFGSDFGGEFKLSNSSSFYKIIRHGD